MKKENVTIVAHLNDEHGKEITERQQGGIIVSPGIVAAIDKTEIVFREYYNHEGNEVHCNIEKSSLFVIQVMTLNEDRIKKLSEYIQEGCSMTDFVEIGMRLHSEMLANGERL